MRIELACCVAALVSTAATAAQNRCPALVAAFGNRLAEVNCFESPDLTTNNTGSITPPIPPTTPDNNSLPGLPGAAFTPVTDRGVIAARDADRNPRPTKVVPGVQLNAYIAADPRGPFPLEGRFLLRLPDNWNGRLVVAGASGTRSEFNGDFAWSDYVLQLGYAYASQNKGVLNLRLSFDPLDGLTCRLNPTQAKIIHFYDNDPLQPFTRWAEFMAAAAQLARRGVEAHYGREPRRTYAVGTSNGGYQVRRVLESYPQLFDGGVDWEGTYVSADAPNLLTDLPPAVLNFPDYQTSGFNADSTAARNIRAAGYPPDIVVGTSSLWFNYWFQFWEVTQCQWQKRLDPSYITYGTDGLGTAKYNYLARLSQSDVGTNMAALATSGNIRRPLITVAGTMDGLLPIDHHARAYARRVAQSLAGHDHDDDRDDDRKPAYRLYEVQNGNHIETFKATFSRLELIEPHAQRAFDLLVKYVEQHEPLPPSQCIPHGGSIDASPAQLGHCANLFEP